MVPTQELWEQPNGQWVRTAGLVITRQRPGSAGGVTFVTMEDETGYVNLIVWNRVAEEQRAALLESRLLEVQGQVQREGDVQHVIARRLTNLSAMLGDLVVASRNFHWSWAGSNIQPDRPHQFDAIALGDDAGAQPEIEFESPVHQLVLKMHVLQRPGPSPGTSASARS